MEIQKVKNPKTDGTITVGKKIYNDLIAEGYYLLNGKLVKDESESSEESESEESISENEENEENEETEESVSESETDESEASYDNEGNNAEEYNNASGSGDTQGYSKSTDANESGEVINVVESKMPMFRKREISYATEALPVIRCVECNKPLAGIYKNYETLKKEGLTPLEIYTLLNIKRPCCRMHLEHPQQINLFQPYEYIYNGNEINLSDVKVKSKLSKNPYLNNNDEIVTIIEGQSRPAYGYNIQAGGKDVGRFSAGKPTLQRKKVINNQVYYEPVEVGMLKNKPINDKYFISYK